MSIKDDFSNYMTVDGYLCPEPVPPCTVRGCDNQPMFTSEYFIMLNRNGYGSAAEDQKYIALINACIGSDGHLHRAPGDPSQDEIDDHLGVLAGYAEILGKVPFALPFALYRFPQLVYAYLLNKGWSPILLAPLGFITALILAFSCIGTPIDKADERRLSWALWQAIKRHSFIGDLAGKLWYWRQKQAYDTDRLMRAVASFYYLPKGLDQSPYSKHWID